MKRKLQGILAVLVCLVILLGNMAVVKVFAEDGNSFSLKNVPNEVEDYVKDNFENFIYVAKEFQQYSTYQIDDESKLSIGDPYIIYMPNEIQDEVYYYPIINKNEGRILFIVGIIGTVNGYTYEVNDNMVNDLNKADYVNGNCVIYKYGYGVYVENRKGEIFNEALTDLMPNQEEVAFEKMPFENKVSKINEKVKELKKVEPISWKNEDELLKSKLKGSLTLRNPMGQYGYQMCWASSVATIVNYLQSAQTVTPFDVCTLLGIGYNDGGSAYDVCSGLSAYGVYYNMIRASSLTWDELKNNIDGNKPISLGASNKNNLYAPNHAVTIYGYTGTSGATNNVFIWDSALNNGNGDYSLFSYNGYSFTSNGEAYVWDRTVSYY
jgi:hypothetical protein